MNDVNYDEFEPVGPSDGGTYSTARPVRKRNVGLAIAVSLLVVIVCAVLTMISLFTVRIEREEGTTSLIFSEPKTDKSRSADRDGVGLGLYIVRTIILSHGEDITVTSLDGVTTFTFSLSVPK